MNRLKNLTIKHQFLLLLAFTIFIVTISINLNYFFNTKLIENKMIDFNNQVIFQVEEKLINYMKNEDFCIESFINNPAVQNFLNEDNYLKKIQLFDSLRRTSVRTMVLNPSIYDIIITDDYGNNYFSYCDKNTVNDLNININNLETTGIIFNNNNFMYTISAPIKSNEMNFRNGSTIGICTFVFYMSDLREIIGENSKIGYTTFYILNKFNNVIVGPRNSRIGKNLEPKYISLLKTSDYSAINNIGSEKLLIQSRLLGNREWKIVSTTSISNLVSIGSQIRDLNILLWLLCLLIMVIIFGIFSRRLSYSFDKILYHMNSVKKGNLHSRVDYFYSNEFSQLSIGFNEMMDKIVELTNNNLNYHKELYEVEISNRQAKLQALQSQINPHFLYNTLECMKSIAVYYEVAEIQEMATALAFIFKYSIKGGNIVKVSEEMQSVKYYLKIQQIRFWDKFEVNINIPDEILNYNMLKFLLQPIIENSIFHGLENKKGKGFLNISAEYSEQAIKFIVQDTGVGIDESTLNLILNNMNSSDTTDYQHQYQNRSIGIVNIHNRIKLFYGNEYGLTVESIYNVGTTITIKVPANGGDQYV